MTVHSKRSGFTMTELLVSIAILVVVMTLLLTVIESTFKTLRVVTGESNASNRARIAMDQIVAELNNVDDLGFVDFHIPRVKKSRSQYISGLQSAASAGCDIYLELHPADTAFGNAPYPDSTLFNQDLNYNCYIEPWEVLDPDPTWTARFSVGKGGTDAPASCNQYLAPGVLAMESSSGVLCNGSSCPIGLNDRNLNPDDRMAENDPFEGWRAEVDQLKPSWSELFGEMCQEDTDSGGFITTHNLTPYITAREDLDGNGTINGQEEFLRTIVFKTKSPKYSSNAASNTPNLGGALNSNNSVEQLSHRVVTFAHTWKEKAFSIPLADSFNGGCDPANYSHLSSDFVLYKRESNFYADPVLNMDLDRDGNPSEEIEDECLRTVETPVTDGVVDVRFKLIDARGDEINAGNQYYYWFDRDPSDNNPISPPITALDAVRAIEIYILTASDDVISVLRSSMDDGKLFSITSGNPGELARLNFLRIQSLQPEIYNPSNFVQLRRKVNLYE